MIRMPNILICESHRVNISAMSNFYTSASAISLVLMSHTEAIMLLSQKMGEQRTKVAAP